MRYFEVKVRYDRKNDNGAIKPVTETYALSAQTFTDAEAAMHDMSSELPVEGNFEVIGEKIANYERFLPTFTHEGDEPRFYEVKYALICIDERTAKEIKDIHYVLVEAFTVEAATSLFLKNVFAGEQVELVSVKKTPIVGVRML